MLRVCSFLNRLLSHTCTQRPANRRHALTMAALSVIVAGMNTLWGRLHVAVVFFVTAWQEASANTSALQYDPILQMSIAFYVNTKGTRAWKGPMNQSPCYTPPLPFSFSQKHLQLSSLHQIFFMFFFFFKFHHSRLCRRWPTLLHWYPGPLLYYGI